MINQSPIIEKIVKEFQEIFTLESPSPEYRELKHEYYLNSTDLESFLTDKLREVERKAWQDGYIHGREGGIAHQKLSHLKSGEEKE